MLNLVDRNNLGNGLQDRNKKYLRMFNKNLNNLLE